MDNVVSLAERRLKKTMKDAVDIEDLGPRYGGILLQAQPPPGPLYRLIIDTPDPEDVTVTLYLDDPAMIVGIKEDTSQCANGRFILDLQMRVPIGQHVFQVFPCENTFECAIYVHGFALERQENVKFVCEWFVDELHLCEDWYR